MLNLITFGVLSSIAAELVIWLNKKLSHTLLQGKAAFLLALVVALIGATVKVATSGVAFEWVTLGTVFAQVWTVAQIFFVVVVETLHLDVKEG